jgi:hypothetical protein
MDYLDYLNQMEDEERRASHSIVNIGTGRVGTRDGADPIAIKRAMADSHLIVDLFVFKPETAMADVRVMRAPLRPVRAWSPGFGGETIPLAAAA